MNLAGWGRYPILSGRLLRPRDCAAAVAAAEVGGLIARGNGRAYGDAAINRETTLSMLDCDRILAFSPEDGRLTCEAGTLLSDIIALFVPKGWFPPVTPGTKFVTVGGMVAADVHGKNHHKVGSFGHHVESFDLATGAGVFFCSPSENADLFAATLGGMGLTGVILRVTFRLMPIETAFIRQETVRARNLDAAMSLFEESLDWTYSVAWIDCLARGDSLGRSLLYRGEHARLDELPADLRAAPLYPPAKRKLSVPLDLPSWTLNRYSVGLFNALYYGKGKPGTALIDYDTFFYPLDAILNWNRIYGGAGFTQYQCVLPKAASPAGLRLLLDRIARSGGGSFLAVLKLFGPQDGMMSFPMDGYTLALDFPASAATFNLLNELDAIVSDHGGRLYLAKDARAGAATIQRGYPALDHFRAIRGGVAAQDCFFSLQSRRLAL
jgi:FAD/FMN-containing dehydrogenase